MMKVKLKNLILFFAALYALSNSQIYGQEYTGESKIILETEKQALNKWANRNVWGYLNLFASDATYFDQTTKMKLIGFEVLTWNNGNT